LDIDCDVNIFVCWSYFHKNVYIVGISVFNNGSNLQQSVKYFENHRTTKKSTQLLFPFLQRKFMYHNYYNVTFISLRFITIELSISHSVLHGFAGWTLHVDFGGFLWRILHCFLLRDNWNCRIGMDLRYVKLQTVKHTQLEISCWSIISFTVGFYKVSITHLWNIILVYKENPS
jgi:hypothetical protein